MSDCEGARSILFHFYVAINREIEKREHVALQLSVGIYFISLFQFPLKSVTINVNETISVGTMVNEFGSGIAIVPLMIIIKSVATSKALGRINKYNVNIFQELLSLGLGNIFASFFKSIPLTACFARSAVSSSSGSKTQITGFPFIWLLVLG